MYSLTEIEGPNATVALKRNLDDVLAAAEQIGGQCDEQSFTKKDLIKLIYVLRKNKPWLPAKEVVWDLV
jgi:hypothetical protein